MISFLFLIRTVTNQLKSHPSHFLLIYRHEKQRHPNFIPKNDNEEQTPDNPIAKPDDHIYNYHCGKLKFGLILFEFNDAVKEGDGQRIHDLYKIALLLYKSGGHYKYAYVVLLYLVKIVSLYTEFGAFQLRWNRFYNKYGLIGKCISLDLKKEQQNKILKRICEGLDQTFVKTVHLGQRN